LELKAITVFLPSPFFSDVCNKYAGKDIRSPSSASYSITLSPTLIFVLNLESGNSKK
jgi:hypothetical protein